MSNPPNPILEQIPLVVVPGSYKTPKAVTLPYDQAQFPENLDAFETQTIQKIQKQFESVKQDEQRLKEEVQQLYTEDDAREFQQWEKQVRMIAPGYIRQDGSTGVMAPTKRK